MQARSCTAQLPTRVAGVVDPVTGTIRLMAKVGDVDEMTFNVGSAKTIRLRE